MAQTLPDSIGFDTNIEIASMPSKTWIIDRNTMQVKTMDEGLESVRQAVEIMLNTDRFRWQIYNSNFGAEVATLIGDDADYIQSELPRMVEDALSVDSRIISVDNYVFTVNGDSMTVTFDVHTVFGAFTEGLEV
jgi:hypothetical protein